MKRILIILSALTVVLGGCAAAPEPHSPAVEMRVSDGWIEYTSDGENWTHLVALDDLKGQNGQDGQDGTDAQSSQFTDENAPSGVAIIQGEKGEKGDPGAVGPAGAQGPAGEVTLITPQPSSTPQLESPSIGGQPFAGTAGDYVVLVACFSPSDSTSPFQWSCSEGEILGNTETVLFVAPPNEGFTDKTYTITVTAGGKTAFKEVVVKGHPLPTAAPTPLPTVAPTSAPAPEPTTVPTPVPPLVPSQVPTPHR